MNLGDKFTMNVPVRRKWWQVWKPKNRQEKREFTVAHVGPEPIRPKNGVALTSDDFIKASIRADNIRYEEFVRKWYIDKLTREIETARRNKKKSSHLVAELKKLENGK